MSDDNSATTSDAHYTFHFSLYAAADSAWLLRLIRPVWETSERYCLEVPQSRQLAARTGEHEEILEACAANDPERAALALHDHLATTANNIAASMGGGPLYPLSSRSPA
jgi:DNA-binding GntR family transcriptional regulator